MKTAIRIIILAAASIFVAISCQKETIGTQDLVKEGETIQVNINASLGDLVAADGTKATAESVIRLKWEGTETDPEYVKAYCGTNLISTGDGLKAIASGNGLFAKLSGEITTKGLTSGTSVITFVYSNVNNIAATNEAPTFDFSIQDANTPFVAYATLVYDGTAPLTDKMVEFKFATSVMKIAATNLGGGNITGATISGINTKVTLTPDEDSETCGISGDNKATISTTNYDASSDSTRAIVTVGLVPDNNKGRNISVIQTGFTNKGVITSAEIEGNKSYTTPASLFTCGTQGEHGYVLIAGTKWATQNLAISASGKGAWLSVKVPGTADTNVQIGDYFQWAAYENYVDKNSEQTDKGLLLYESFINDGTNSDNNKFSLKSKCSQGFVPQSDMGGNAAYYPYFDWDGCLYKKYTDNGSVLALTDDVANIFWQGGWRMPTSAEFTALVGATFWKWDATDKGYYVYAPQSGDEGKRNNSNGEYGKSNALLFFPATGYAIKTGIDDSGFSGCYWTRTGAGNNGKANNLYFRYSPSRTAFEIENQNYRYYGYQVRPVSDK